MERRLLTFIVASTAFFMFYLSLRMMFAPPPPPVVPGAEQVAEADGDELLDGENTVAKSAQAEEAAAEEEPSPQRPEQTEWLKMIKDHIATSASISIGDFELTPFQEKGGAVRANKVFEEHLDKLLEELNGVLVA